MREADCPTTDQWRGRYSARTGIGKIRAASVALAFVAIVHATAAPAPAPGQLPAGGVVTAGAASLSRSGDTLTIDQTSLRASITWSSFDIGSAATVDFIQPSAGAVVLNRVTEMNPTQIFGHLDATGQVFLVNPSGVYFAPGASVNVGALVAAAASISDADFMAGDYAFVRDTANGSIVNQGALNARPGGYVALLAPQVRNDGLIVARLGTVALAAGDAYTLQISGADSLASLIVSPSTIRALVENGDAVQAPGGLIILSALAADQVQGGVVNNNGALEADGILGGAGGTVRLIASGALEQSGSISAQGGSASAAGGFVETSGASVRIAPGATVDTQAPGGHAGQWLIDPADFTIASSGGDITAGQLESLLAANSVTIQTTATGANTSANLYGGTPGSGAINVDQNLTWTNNTLSLLAAGAINVNAVMTAVNASLVLDSQTSSINMGLNGGGFTGQVNFTQADGVTPRSGAGFLTIDGHAYTVITELGAQGSRSGLDLQGINGDPDGYFALGSDLEAASTSGWNSGAGFMPLGSLGAPFVGVFDGLGHTITDIAIDRPGANYVGLFGYAENAAISNVGLVNASITGGAEVGGLVGRDLAEGVGAASTITNSFVTGSIDAVDAIVGGLVGRDLASSPAGGSATASITNSFSDASVTSGNGAAGGLVGVLDTNAASAVATVSNSYATGAVSELNAGGSLVGGLVGSANDADQAGAESIANSFSTGPVTAAADSRAIGGLVGQLNGAALVDSYAIGTVTAGPGAQRVAALAGEITGSGSIADSFYDRDVNGAMPGVGLNVKTRTVADIAGQYWGMTSAQLMNSANFIGATAANGFVDPGWNLTGVWGFASFANAGFPYLLSLPNYDGVPIYALLVGGSSDYGTPPDLSYELYSNSSGTGGSVIANAEPSGAAAWSTPLTAFTGAGAYAETYAGGLSLGNAAYVLLPGASVIWTIDRAVLTVTANNQSRLYGLVNPVFTQTLSGFVDGQTAGDAGVAGTAVGASAANAASLPGSYTIIASVGSLTAADYVFTPRDGTLTIQPAPTEPPPPTLGEPGYETLDATEPDDLPDSVETPDEPAVEAAAPAIGSVAPTVDADAPLNAPPPSIPPPTPAPAPAADTTPSPAPAAVVSIAPSTKRTCDSAPHASHPCPPHRSSAGVHGRLARPVASRQDAATLRLAIRKRVRAISLAAAAAAARGNEPLPGDVMAQSFESNVWLDNSDPANTGKTRAVRDFSQSLTNTNTMIIFTLLVPP